MWNLIGAGEVSSESFVDKRLDAVRESLLALPQPRLVEFQGWLYGVLSNLDRRVFAEVPARLSDGTLAGQSSDHFLYARCACVLGGEMGYRGVIDGSVSFSRYTSTASQGAELLLYLATEVSEEYFGIAIDGRGEVDIESGSNRLWW